MQLQAQAQSETDLIRRVTVVVNKSRTIRFDQPFEKAVVGAPDIVDALPTNNQTLYVQGKKTGTTNVSVFDSTGRLIEVLDIDVVVDAAYLQSRVRSIPGAGGIVVSSSGEHVVLSGVAADAVAADRAVQTVQAFYPKAPVVNTMRIAAASSQQVMLKVQFLEVSRDAQRALGVNLYATSPPGASRGFTTGVDQPSLSTTAGVPIFQTVAGAAGAANAPFGVFLANIVNRGTQVDAMVTALETQGLVRRLAEPTLIALSGDSASFHAGGEFPVPVPQPGSAGGAAQFTIEFKKFGVELAFTPTVLSNGMINLRLVPSVSELDFSTGVTILGTSVPGLTSREARTTVELRDGQSFAIAGLLQTRGRRNVSQLPWIGSVPVLGTLFRSAQFQENETDLVVIVTPHLVAPTTPEQRLATPFDQRLPSNDLDFFLLGQMELRKRYTDYVTSGGNLQGPYGHMIRAEPPAAGAPSQR
ncbi:MAG TPA: type II and III secretion system protein family protein [Xanthobacteraceae bacterium]|nr:type II and III secretion system protein family protein [Xanthobacteraceae bacterium]